MFQLDNTDLHFYTTYVLSYARAAALKRRTCYTHGSPLYASAYGREGR